MSNILNWSIRGFQAALAVINLGLASYGMLKKITAT